MRLSAVQIKTGVFSSEDLRRIAVAAGMLLLLCGWYSAASAQTCVANRDEERIRMLQERVTNLDKQRAEAQVEVASGKLQQAAADAKANWEANAATLGVSAADRILKRAEENLRIAEGRPARLKREIDNYQKELDGLLAKPVCAPGTTPTPAPPRTAKKQEPGQYYQKDVPPLRTFTPPSRAKNPPGQPVNPQDRSLGQGGG